MWLDSYSLIVQLQPGCFIQVLKYPVANYNAYKNHAKVKNNANIMTLKHKI